MCVFVGRECTVPSDCWEHMCWRRPECVLKWRLMNERPECVCVDETQGSVDVCQSAQTSVCVYLQCVYALVCVRLCECMRQVTLYLLRFHHPLSHSCEVQSDMRETHKASPQLHNSTSSKCLLGVCVKRREENEEMIICMCTFVTISNHLSNTVTDWQVKGPGCSTSINKQGEKICFCAFRLKW